ncbi:DUF6452 family protein [Flavobacterium wongokense]|uniref:DUF6452 family protein n=1 Tax=Flavobacterium wongokense TaxID=2910674 RepID=UPI001F40BE82|nr:DUF6452 family protein [Flavobacterium sp. WG47]MCF6131998.1 DUF6452 family protein [Flavobacterium sp. WG47]
MKKILALLLIAIAFSSCEKDDICTEETTPRLILEFYDVSNPGTLKNVVNLKVKGVGAFNDLDLGTFNGSKVELPLKIDDLMTKYSLILNSTAANPNEDVLQFDYTHEDVFVSRACGYKTIFTLNNPNGVTLTDSATPDTFWMQDVNVLTPNIETENETHIKILF